MWYDLSMLTFLTLVIKDWKTAVLLCPLHFLIPQYSGLFIKVIFQEVYEIQFRRNLNGMCVNAVN